MEGKTINIGHALIEVTPLIRSHGRDGIFYLKNNVVLKSDKVRGNKLAKKRQGRLFQKKLNIFSVRERTL